MGENMLDKLQRTGDDVIEDWRSAKWKNMRSKFWV